MEPMLDLPGFVVTGFEERADGMYHFTATPARYMPYCPNCGGTICNIHSRTRRFIRDLRINERNVGVTILGKRYSCLKCGRTFSEEYDAIDKKAMMTKRLKAHLITACIVYSFSGLAARYAMSTATIKRLFDEFDAYANSQQRILAPRTLGLFYININTGRHACAIDLDENALIDIMPAYDSGCVLRFLESMQGRRNVKVVFVEPVGEVRDILLAYLPEARVVLDRVRARALLRSNAPWQGRAAAEKALLLDDMDAAQARLFALKDTPKALLDWRRQLFDAEFWTKQEDTLRTSIAFFQWNDALQAHYPFNYRVLRNKLLFRTAATHFAQYELKAAQSNYDYVFSYRLYTDIPVSPLQYEMLLVRGTGAGMNTLMALYPGGMPRKKTPDDAAREINAMA